MDALLLVVVFLLCVVSFWFGMRLGHQGYIAPLPELPKSHRKAPEPSSYLPPKVKRERPGAEQGPGSDNVAGA